jgi:hypothetical protein
MNKGNRHVREIPSIDTAKKNMGKNIRIETLHRSRGEGQILGPQEGNTGRSRGTRIWKRDTEQKVRIVTYKRDAKEQNRKDAKDRNKQAIHL